MVFPQSVGTAAFLQHTSTRWVDYMGVNVLAVYVLLFTHIIYTKQYAIEQDGLQGYLEPEGDARYNNTITTQDDVQWIAKYWDELFKLPITIKRFSWLIVCICLFS